MTASPVPRSYSSVWNSTAAATAAGSVATITFEVAAVAFAAAAAVAFADVATAASVVAIGRVCFVYVGFFLLFWLAWLSVDR